MKSNYNFTFLIGISIVAALGGLLFGYDWVVIGGAKFFYERFFNIADIPKLQGLAMSSALWGCIPGAVFSGYISDRFGRKLSLKITAAGAPRMGISPSIAKRNIAPGITGAP